MRLVDFFGGEVLHEMSGAYCHFFLVSGARFCKGQESFSGDSYSGEGVISTLGDDGSASPLNRVENTENEAP